MTKLVNQFYKTRIAPTPSGFLHLGNAFSFALTAALARKTGAKILLRIDDMDRARVQEEYVQDIFDSLAFLGIPIDEGPTSAADFEKNYSQLHRIDFYNEALDILRNKGLIFACDCSRITFSAASCTCLKRNIDLDEKDVNWRLKTRPNTSISVKGYDGRPVRSKLPSEIQNFIVRKRDGFPSYQLCSIVDDLFYGVDLIVRGEDLWASTLAQHELAFALERPEFQDITFYHHPLIEEKPGKKLSKSAGSTSIRFFRECNKSPGDVYALIAMMPGSSKPIVTFESIAQIAAYFLPI